MFKKMFIIITLLTMVCGSSAMAATYQFYHVAVRDFDGNGSGDQIRYGFTYNKDASETDWANLNGWYARANGDSTTDKSLNNGVPYYEAGGNGATVGSSFVEQNYWSGRWENLDVTKVELFDNNNVLQASHNVNLPTFSSHAVYNGFDINTVTWENQNGGVMFSWGQIIPSENSSYRFTLESSDWQYSIFQKIDGTQTNLFVPDSLLSGKDWMLNFQERIENPLYATDGTSDNFNWLRLYAVQDSIPIDISLAGSTATNHVPIPGSILLLGSGIIGLVGFKTRRK